MKQLVVLYHCLSSFLILNNGLGFDLLSLLVNEDSTVSKNFLVIDVIPQQNITPMLNQSQAGKFKEISLLIICPIGELDKPIHVIDPRDIYKNPKGVLIKIDMPAMNASIFAAIVAPKIVIRSSFLCFTKKYAVNHNT